MTQWNVYILLYVAAVVTVGFFTVLKSQNWKIFDFLRKESISSLEQKLYSFDQSLNPIIITDEDGIVTSINLAMEEMFGWKESDLIGTDMKLMIPEESFVCHQEGLRRAKGKELEDKRYNLIARKKDKSLITVELLLRKRRNNDKYFYISIIRDMTIELKLRHDYEIEIASLKLQLDIVNKGEEIGTTGSWYWDLHTIDELNETQLTTSMGYRRITGVGEASNYDARYLKSRIWSEDTEIVNAALEKAFNGEPYDITYRLNRSSDFKVVFIRSIVWPVKNKDGVITGMYGSTRLLQTLNIIEAIKTPPPSP